MFALFGAKSNKILERYRFQLIKQSQFLSVIEFLRVLKKQVAKRSQFLSVMEFPRVLKKQVAKRS